MAILPTLAIDRASLLCRFFTPYQVHWITVEDPFHGRKQQCFILAEKSVRIGWTFADAFKNVRKRLRFKERDYLFATKDYPSALEYMRLCHKFADVFNLTRSIISHGEEYLKIPSLDPRGKPTGFTEEVKIGMIKFDNGSRIIAFSAHPQAMAVYGGDVGLDEFGKHNHARLLWETAQGRVAWGGDLAVWSAHDGEDTLFNEFALEARNSTCSSRLQEAPINSGSSCSSRGNEAQISLGAPPQIHPAELLPDQTNGIPDGTHGIHGAQNSSASRIQSPESRIQKQSANPWTHYYRVTLPDAIDLGLLEVINRTQQKNFARDQFIAGCRARARQEEVFQQSYMCNPLGASTNHIVEWSAIERCRYDYDFIRVHLEHSEIVEKFGEFRPSHEEMRADEIRDFIHSQFRPLFTNQSSSFSSSKRSDSHHSSAPSTRSPKFRLGFDVAASGQGDLAVIYIDEVQGEELWLAGLFSCRTEDWHFLQTVLFKFLKDLRSVRGAGDASGLGRQICWDAANRFSYAFEAVNFSSKKHDLGFALMNQLATAKKRFPRSEQDIAADFFALRKSFEGNRWVFSEGRNTLSPNSHCDIAWAAALASHAHPRHSNFVGAMVG
jgi:phage FluMu gp28-like protein